MDTQEPIYRIDRTIRETGALFDDGSHILYVNGSWRDESPTGRLMHDFSCTDPDDMYYALLADRARYFKEDKEGIQTMSKFSDELRDEGAKENLLANLKALMLNLNFTIEQAMDALNVPLEDRDSVKSRVATP